MLRASLGYELINVGYSRRPTWNVPMVFQFGEFRVDSTQHTHTHTLKKKRGSVKYQMISGNPSLVSVWTEPEEVNPGVLISPQRFAQWESCVFPCAKMRSKRRGLGEHHGWTWRDVTHAAGGETSVWRSDTGCGAGSTRSVDQELQQQQARTRFYFTNYP